MDAYNAPGSFFDSNLDPALLYLPTANFDAIAFTIRKLRGVTENFQLITIGTLITMTFHMVLVTWVYIWPTNSPKGHFIKATDIFVFSY